MVTDRTFFVIRHTHLFMSGQRQMLRHVQTLCGHVLACRGQLGWGGAHWKYLAVSLLPRRQGVVPTDCLMIQEPCVTRGISLNVLLRRAIAALLSPPAKNLITHNGAHSESCSLCGCRCGSTEKETSSAQPGKRLGAQTADCITGKAATRHAGHRYPNTDPCQSLLHEEIS